jgi:uncharacterized membrane protein
MAGIGFVLRDLNRQGNLVGLVRAYGHGVIVAAGPWLFTILCLSAMNMVALPFTDPDKLALTRTIIVYNFAASLIISGPFVMTNTRYLADRIYVKQVKEIPGMLLGSMLLVFAALAVPGIVFYGFMADLPVGLRVLAIINLLACGGIWTSMLFLTTLKNFKAVTTAFGVGMLFALFITIGGMHFGTVGLVASFTAGLIVVLYILIGEVFVEYPFPVSQPFAFVGYLRKYWELALSGLLYNLAIWIDKFVMWAAPQHITLARVMPTYPAYDGAMFMAFLTFIPGMTLFLISAETRFYEEYSGFYSDIRNKANYRDIQSNQRRLLRVVYEIVREVTTLQAIICALTILLAYQLIEFTSRDYSELGIFRFGVLGVLFHSLLLFTSIFVIYFDLRRMLLLIYAVFFVTNGLFTYIAMHRGFVFYGFGYFAASLVSFLTAFVIFMMRIRKLPFLTFVANNQSVKAIRPSLPIPEN